MSYPDSFMEWVVGVPTPNRVKENQGKRRDSRSRSPHSRIIVHIETSDSEYEVSAPSSDEDKAAKKKVHFAEQQEKMSQKNQVNHKEKSAKKNTFVGEESGSHCQCCSCKDAKPKDKGGKSHFDQS